MVGDGFGSLAVGLEAPLSRLAEAGAVEPVGVLQPAARRPMTRTPAATRPAINRPDDGR
jgi:hypothetical protein